MQKAQYIRSARSLCVREQRAIALIAGGADPGDVSALTGLTFDQILHAWRQRSASARTTTLEKQAEPRAFRLML